MKAIFDAVGSLKRMGNDESLFHEMADLLRSDAPPLLIAVQSAQREGDIMRLHRAAHTLKGLAANFGAARAVGAAAKVEQLAKAQPSADRTAALPEAIAELEHSLEELIAALTTAPEATPSTTS